MIRYSASQILYVASSGICWHHCLINMCYRQPPARSGCGVGVGVGPQVNGCQPPSQSLQGWGGVRVYQCACISVCVYISVRVYLCACMVG